MTSRRAPRGKMDWEWYSLEEGGIRVRRMTRRKETRSRCCKMMILRIGSEPGPGPRSEDGGGASCRLFDSDDRPCGGRRNVNPLTAPCALLCHHASSIACAEYASQGSVRENDTVWGKRAELDVDVVHGL